MGLRDAWFPLRFWHSRPWLAHLLSDRYLSREQFRELCASVFPGARFDDLGFALAMAWAAAEQAWSPITRLSAVSGAAWRYAA
ncbi:hypothetical protein ACWCRF_27480 [Streptomyces sp. NPDC002405]